jgi:hypothetical protein
MEDETGRLSRERDGGEGRPPHEQATREVDEP